MRVQLTGATGFVGKNLIPYLTSLNIETVSLAREGLRDELSFVNTYSIIHLAGKAHDLKKSSNPEEYYQVNYELTKKLYDVFLKSNCKKFIFISSVKAVADVIDSVLTEDTEPNPLTDYGKSKRMAEEYILGKVLPSDKSVYILRPCMIHGPGNKGNLNLLYKFVQKDIPYPLASFENKRSFLSVENLCFVVANLLKRDIPSGVYNVADDDVLSTNEVVEILANSLNKKPKLLAIPQGIVRVLATFGDVFNLPLNTERLNKLTENYIVSNKKIKEAINLPLPITTKSGLLITANSFKR